jgi:hypothetical protein
MHRRRCRKLNYVGAHDCTAPLRSATRNASNPSLISTSRSTRLSCRFGITGRPCVPGDTFRDAEQKARRCSGGGPGQGAEVASDPGPSRTSPYRFIGPKKVQNDLAIVTATVANPPWRLGRFIAVAPMRCPAGSPLCTTHRSSQGRRKKGAADTDAAALSSPSPSAVAGGPASNALASGTLFLCYVIRGRRLWRLVGGTAMDSAALHALIAEVRGTAAALAEAEKRVASATAELAQGSGVQPAQQTRAPIAKRGNSGWVAAG